MSAMESNRDPMKADRVQGRQQEADALRERAEAAGWRLGGGGKVITKTYELPSFRAALAFVAYVGELAEAADHHPEIDIRFKKVTLFLSTHSEGRVTEKDWELAGRVG